MPQREPARHQTAGEPPSAKVKMRLDAKGRWAAVLPEDETPEPTESAEPAPEPDETVRFRRQDSTP